MCPLGLGMKDIRQTTLDNLYNKPQMFFIVHLNICLSSS